MTEITHLIHRIQDGDSHAADELLPIVYSELRKLAAYRLRKDGGNQTLQSTELVHEAFLRLVDVDDSKNWNGRGHFFAAAAESMRRILVDRARRRRALKRGGDANHVSLEDDFVASDGKSEQVLALDEAVSRLAKHDEQAALLVKLRFFGGMQHGEVAEAMGISRRAADRLWLLARTWLYKQLKTND